MKWPPLGTLVVLTLCPLLQLHPDRSGSTLHSSPGRQGSIWHHHLCRTMEAVGAERKEGRAKLSESTVSSQGGRGGVCPKELHVSAHPWLFGALQFPVFPLLGLPRKAWAHNRINRSPTDPCISPKTAQGDGCGHGDYSNPPGESPCH